MADPPLARRPGRQRSEGSRTAILAAAIALVSEAGYAALTIEGMARRAGCGKQTIYRWWPGKADVLLDALGAKAVLYIPVTDRGSYRDDLRAFLEASFALARQPQVTRILRALMAEAQVDEEFGGRFREAFLQRRRDALAQITVRARQRGDLPAGLSPGTAADLVFGVIWYRTLATRQPLDQALVGELLQALGAADREAGTIGTTGTTGRN
jgi:AcrR family transcriptional regulator